MAGISRLASFYAHEQQIIAGIGWELCCRTWQETGDLPAYFDPLSSRTQLAAAVRPPPAINPAVFAALADETLLIKASIQRKTRTLKLSP